MFSSEQPILIFESLIQSGGSSSLILEPPPSGVISSHSEKNPQSTSSIFPHFVLGFVPIFVIDKFHPKSETILHQRAKLVKIMKWSPKEGDNYPLIRVEISRTWHNWREATNFSWWSKKREWRLDERVFKGWRVIWKRIEGKRESELVKIGDLIGSSLYSTLQTGINIYIRKAYMEIWKLWLAVIWLGFVYEHVYNHVRWVVWWQCVVT